MRHRIKKIPTLNKLSHKYNHLLHSDKSTYTYFYKSKVRSLLYSPSIPLLGGVALLLVLGCMINPVNNTRNAYALTASEECEAGNSVLALDMSGELQLNKNVDEDIANGDISYLSKNFTVTACRTNGYKIYIWANSSKLQNQQAPDALFGVGENVVPTNFQNNTWGYAVAEAASSDSDLSYSTMPEVSLSKTESFGIDKSTGAQGQNLKITFAAKFGEDKVAGHYSTDILLSVIPNAWDVITTTMQEFAEAGACNEMLVGDQIQLIDDRSASGIEQTIYWVGKLKDGQCWMTQNLDLPLTSSTVLKAEDTDLPNGVAEFNTTGLNNYSDPGLYNYKTSQLGTSTSSPCSGGLSSYDCSRFFEQFSGEIEGNVLTHYLVGNYYPFNIATAGNTSMNTFREGSICPKGWRLPAYGQRTEGFVNDFSVITSLGTNFNAIRQEPYYYIPIGYNGSTSAGTNGYYWTSQPAGISGNSNLAYYFMFSTSVSNVFYTGYTRADGYPIRCIAR